MKLVFDEVGKRFYETGVEAGVLYVRSGAAYPTGVPWNGLVSVAENPSGAESNKFYADNIEYLNLLSAEEFSATIECYTYPDEFSVCDGSVDVGGASIGQQSRAPFGFAYKTKIGNDTDLDDHGYKIHLVYGAQASPSQKTYSSINDSPEPLTFSYEISTTPVKISEKVNDKTLKPTSTFILDSTKIPEAKMKELEDIIYGKDPTTEGGSDGLVASLPLPDDIIKLLMATDPAPAPEVPDAG